MVFPSERTSAILPLEKLKEHRAAEVVAMQRACQAR